MPSTSCASDKSTSMPMDFSMSGSTPPRIKTLSVSEIVSRIANAVRISVGSQWVEGEISNLGIPDSGHAYFTLKDSGGQIACVIFKSRLAQCRIKLRDGLKVRVYGEANVFEKRGQIQLNLTKIEETGLGELQARFLELKLKLESEGLFDSSKKKPIPTYPKALGLITSATGAAIQDIRHILEKRAPWLKVYLIPVAVQGTEAQHAIAAAIRAWGHAPSNGLPIIDTLIIARGGGSIEDLWNFNEEIVARAIASCPIPIISGVGHETDFTIADFVADMRAPTPTAAAMMASPDGQALKIRLNTTHQTLISRADQILRRAEMQLSYCERSRLTKPTSLIEPYAQLIDDLELNIKSSIAEKLRDQTHRLESLELKLKSQKPSLFNERRQEQIIAITAKLNNSVHRRLQAMTSQLDLIDSRLRASSPQNTLDRGFALIHDPSGKLVRTPEQIETGDSLKIIVSQGQFVAKKE
ncbi:MAG: exodeoxyribonuclease VII large subunit [Akkermansia sp.]